MHKFTYTDRPIIFTCVQFTLFFSLLLGNPAKAERILGWKRTVDFNSLVKEMVEADLKASKSLVEDQN